MRIRVFLHSPLCSVLPDDPQPHTSLPQRQSQNTLFLHILAKAQANPSKTHIKKDNLPLTPTLQHESGHPIPLFPNGEDSGHYKRRLFREDKYESGLVTAKDDALLSFEQELDYLRETNLGIQEGKCDTNYSFALNGNSSDANLGVEESETSANYIGFTPNEGRDHTQLYTSVLDHATLEEENADILIIENFPSTSGWPSENTLKAASDELREASSVGRACTNNTFSRNNVINRRTHLNRCGVSRSWEKLWQYEEESNAEAPTLSEESYGETINNVLDIVKGLPRNVTLQEKLDDFYGRIDVICGNAILYRLMKEGLYWPALSCFEWV